MGSKQNNITHYIVLFTLHISHYSEIKTITKWYEMCLVKTTDYGIFVLLVNVIMYHTFIGKLQINTGSMQCDFYATVFHAVTRNTGADTWRQDSTLNRIQLACKCVCNFLSANFFVPTFATCTSTVWRAKLERVQT